MKRLNNKGFTLIELLATLAVLSLVITIVIYISTSVITNAKQNSYQVTINNIEKTANSYVIENKGDSYWLKNSDNTEYQCITVQNLIDKGFFKNDVLSSEISDGVTVSNDNMIYLERNQYNKTVIRNILLVGEKSNYTGLCGDFKVSGSISFDVEPDLNIWSKKKDITIYYNVKNNIDKVSNYTYNYQFNDETYSDNFNNRSVTKEITVTENGDLIANIYNGSDSVSVNTLHIGKIDNEGPVIEQKYTGPNVVRGSVTIPLILSDAASGVDYSSFGLSDLKVTIGGVSINSGLTLEPKNDNSYDLIIEDLSNEGNVIITIPNNSLFDVLGNGNDSIVLNPDVKFSNVYMIDLNGNGATSSGTTSIYEKYNTGIYRDSSLSNKMTTSSNPITKPTRSYTITYDLNSTGATQSASTGTVNYAYNGHYTATSGGTQMINSDGYITSDFTTTKYTSNQTLYAQWTARSTTLATITKTGYTCKWNTKSDGTGIEYDSGKTDYTTDGNVTLYAICTANKVTIKYKLGSGESLTNSTTDNGVTYTWDVDSNNIIQKNGKPLISTIKYGESIHVNGLSDYNNGKYLKITKVGYTGVSSNEWKCVSSSCIVANKTYSQTTNTYTADDFCDASSEDCEVILGVNWTPDTYTISLNGNGAMSLGTTTIYEKYNTGIYKDNSLSMRMTTSNNAITKPIRSYTITYDLNSTGATQSASTGKVNYTYNGYYTTASGGTQLINSNGYITSEFTTTKYTSNQTLYAQWTAGSTTLATITKTGHTCKWNTKNDGTGDNYNSGNTGYTTDKNVTLYAICTANKVTIKYKLGSGEKITAQTKNKDKTETYNWTVDSNNIIMKNGSYLTATIEYGKEIGGNGLANYNNGNYMKITKTGYTAVSSKQWKCISGCTVANKTYNQATTSYTASDFCDISNGNCEVILGVNWKKNSSSGSGSSTGGNDTTTTEYYCIEACGLRPNCNICKDYFPNDTVVNSIPSDDCTRNGTISRDRDYNGASNEEWAYRYACDVS
ncbi:MAG: prepilin-type N-terminal cleavage/methylation domain-containing protein [Bacilli bacterium]|nr:prepilin-type N-terminal cleavage/methylation domain-containing protein [Bacilli bacterium]